MTPSMLTEKISGPQAWTRDSLSPEDWTVSLSPEATDELRAVLAELRRSPVPVMAIEPRDHALDACRAAMARVREVTSRGPMFAMLDRLPME